MEREDKMDTINKNTVNKIIRDTGTWTGYIAPCNVNSFHITGGWCLGYKITVTSIVELDQLIDEFRFYNCGPELGQRVRLWQERSPRKPAARL